MPRSAPARRLAPAVTLPDSPQPADEPPAPPRDEPKDVQLVHSTVFRVGEYEVGEGYCPRLHGHPGIRY